MIPSSASIEVTQPLATLATPDALPPPPRARSALSMANLILWGTKEIERNGVVIFATAGATKLHTHWHGCFGAARSEDSLAEKLTKGLVTGERSVVVLPQAAKLAPASKHQRSNTVTFYRFLQSFPAADLNGLMNEGDPVSDNRIARGVQLWYQLAYNYKTIMGFGPVADIERTAPKAMADAPSIIARVRDSISVLNLPRMPHDITGNSLGSTMALLQGYGNAAHENHPVRRVVVVNGIIEQSLRHMGANPYHNLHAPLDIVMGTKCPFVKFFGRTGDEILVRTQQVGIEARVHPKSYGHIFDDDFVLECLAGRPAQTIAIKRENLVTCH